MTESDDTMVWGSPLALLLLLGAIPAILILHSLRPKGLQVKTTTLFLWERVLKERHLKLQLEKDGKRYDAIWFGHADALPDMV